MTATVTATAAAANGYQQRPATAHNARTIRANLEYVRPEKQKVGTVSMLPPAGPRAQGWTGEVRERHCRCWAGVGVHPLAIGQDRPSRLGPAGEGRSDGGVLHLHPRGQARYPEGGRRREDEPPGKGGAFAPIQETTSTRATSTWRTVRARGCRPGPCGVWAVAPAVSTPHCLRGTRQDLPCTSAGESRTPGRVPLACH